MKKTKEPKTIETADEAPKPKAPEPIIERTDVRHDFTIEEIGEIARKAALANQRANDLEEKKKQVTKDYAAQIEAAQAEVNTYSIKISNGYEMRDTECIVTLDPKNSSKDYHVKKTGAFVRRAEMDRNDFQISMRFEKEAEAEAKKKTEAAGKASVGEALDKARSAANGPDGSVYGDAIAKAANGDGPPLQSDPNDLRTPAAWCEEQSIEITEPKGWSGIYAKPMDKEISRAEFETRKTISIIRSLEVAT